MRDLKNKRHYFCPYCGKEYEDSNWSFDHVIPLVLGGPKKFKIISCIDCNTRISKRIEQPTMQTPSIRHKIAQLKLNGYKIRTRRRKDYIPLHRGIGHSCGVPAKVCYREENGHGNMCIDFLDFPKDLTLHQITIPSDHETETDIISFASLASKIILGTCYWLWGEQFGRSKYADSLREIMWKNRLEDILQLERSEHHAVWNLEKNEDIEELNKFQEDALDNTPHTTICIFCFDNIVFGLVNIFGEIESMTRIGEIDPNLKIGIEERGTVVIAKTTKNKVLRMTLTEYENAKLRNN